MKYVPRSGRAETEQGELIRAVEKLADEARRHGNAHWSEDFERLAEFVRDRLTTSSSSTAPSRTRSTLTSTGSSPTRSRCSTRRSTAACSTTSSSGRERTRSRSRSRPISASRSRGRAAGRTGRTCRARRAAVGRLPALEADDHLAQTARRHLHARCVAVARALGHDDPARARSATRAGRSPTAPNGSPSSSTKAPLDRDASRRPRPSPSDTGRSSWPAPRPWPPRARRGARPLQPPRRRRMSCA